MNSTLTKLFHLER